jgi:Flp pilus assembly protein TadG
MMAPDPGSHPARRRRLLQNFGLGRKGATAVEFAIIAPIFVGLLISVLETALYVFAQSAMQAAAAQAGRLFLTGQAQTQGLNAAQLVGDVCPPALFTCGNMMVDVENYSSCTSPPNTSMPTLTFNAQGQVTNSWNYNPWTDGQIVVVRLMYQWPVVAGPLSLIVPNYSNGTSLIMGVAAIRVEPYS